MERLLEEDRRLTERSAWAGSWVHLRYFHLFGHEASSLAGTKTRTAIRTIRGFWWAGMFS